MLGKYPGVSGEILRACETVWFGGVEFLGVFCCLVLGFSFGFMLWFCCCSVVRLVFSVLLFGLVWFFPSTGLDFRVVAALWQALRKPET